MTNLSKTMLQKIVNICKYEQNSVMNSLKPINHLQQLSVHCQQHQSCFVYISTSILHIIGYIYIYIFCKFNCCSSTVVSFSPHPSHPHSPSSILPLFGFVQVSFVDVPENTSAFPDIIPSHLPSGHCQFALYFHVSVIFYSLVCFVDQVPLTGEIIGICLSLPGLFHLA